MTNLIDSLYSKKIEEEKIFNEKIEKRKKEDNIIKNKIQQKCEQYMQAAIFEIISEMNSLHNKKINDKIITIKNSIDLNLEDLKKGIFLEVYIDNKYFFSLRNEIKICLEHFFPLEKDMSSFRGYVKICRSVFLQDDSYILWKKTFDFFNEESDIIDVTKFLSDISEYIVNNFENIPKSLFIDLI
jgi:hypothetical protein